MNTCLAGLLEGREIPNICFFSVLVNKWWSLDLWLVCQVCVYASIYVWMHVSFVQYALANGTSVTESACASAAAAFCASVLFTSWLGGSGQGGDAMCRLLSSLYRNDRPCCFTCRGGRSVALSLHRLSITRTQVLPVKITWVSPYVLRPSTTACLRGITGTTNWWTELFVVLYMNSYLFVREHAQC